MFTQKFTVRSSNLNLLQLQETGIIRSLKTTNQTLLNQFQQLGLSQGSTITLAQKYPQFIIQLGQTHLTLNAELAKAIYVRLID